MTEDALNARIARRIRSRRGELGLSLDSLAQRSGVSRSMISLIERAESSATAVVLDRLAAGLGLPLAALFDEPSPGAAPISHAADRAVWRDPATGYVRRALSPPGFPSPIQMAEVELPAGACVAYESSHRDAEIHQQILMQQGSIELTHGDTVHHLSQGDCLAMRLDAPTSFRNPARKPARYLVVVATI